MTRCIRQFILILVGVSSLAIAEPKELILPYPNSLNANSHPSVYFERLLQLALEKTDAQGSVKLVNATLKLPKERLRKMLIQKQGLDIIWSTSTHQREEEMLAVKVNLLKGINEYRLLLIRQEDQSIFDSINTIDDLRKYTLGTGMHWSDTDIFKNNDFNCFITADYQNMFAGLRRKRFDFMVRSIHEIQTELDNNQDLNLAKENHLLIHYPQPIYFFLHKSNKTLAKRIKKGLEIAQEDGSFDELFFEFPIFRQAMQDINQAKIDRTLIEITVN